MIVSKISQNNNSLLFIDKRIKDEKYRGNKSSQHNRYTMDQIVGILELLDKHAPSGDLMHIRTADLKKRPENTPEEYIYASFCNDAKKNVGIGTQDAMRKNLFVDMHRMGFIERYDSNKIPTNPYSKQTVKYVSITQQGVKLITSKTILDKYFIFSKGIDKLLGGFINILLEIFRNENYNIDKISIDEYMFFVSAVATDTNFNLSTDEAVELIKEYRNLSSVQRKSVKEILKIQLNPNNYKGSKTEKRDFHNWRNRVMQIYYLLNQTVYFEVRGEQLVLKEGKNSLKEEMGKIDRSLSQKFEYFSKHNIKKTSGFELHHVVPLSWSESIHHFKMLDVWQNMVYIDAFSHAKITQNGNRNVIMNVDSQNIILSDYLKNDVYLKFQENILYKTENQDVIYKYNKEMLNTVKI